MGMIEIDQFFVTKGMSGDYNVTERERKRGWYGIEVRRCTVNFGAGKVVAQPFD